MRILVVAAHPDDETLGCGSTIAALVHAGHDVRVLVVADGETARPYAGEQDIVRREEQCVKACAHLGVQIAPEFLRLPDNCLDHFPVLRLARIIENRLNCVDVVFTHHLHDLNVDHRAVAEAVLVATRPMAGSVRQVYSFESLSSTEWSFESETFAPNVFVPVDLEKKLEAMLFYKDELRPFPHPRSRQAISALAQYRGAQAGFEAAEAFRLVRSRGLPCWLSE